MGKSETKAGFGSLLLTFILIVPPAALLAGYTVQTCWNWFQVPLGLPALSLPHAIGMDLLVTFMASAGAPMKPPDVSNMDYGKHLLKRMFVRPVAMLAFAWLAHAWMVSP